LTQSKLARDLSTKSFFLLPDSFVVSYPYGDAFSGIS